MTPITSAIQPSLDRERRTLNRGPNQGSHRPSGTTPEDLVAPPNPTPVGATPSATGSGTDDVHPASTAAHERNPSSQAHSTSPSSLAASRVSPSSTTAILTAACSDLQSLVSNMDTDKIQALIHCLTLELKSRSSEGVPRSNSSALAVAPALPSNGQAPKFPAKLTPIPVTVRAPSGSPSVDQTSEYDSIIRRPLDTINYTSIPPFNGEMDEDVDEWIDKIDTLLHESGAEDHEVIAYLFLVLGGNAKKFFLSLGSPARRELKTWSAWAERFRRFFRPCDYHMKVRRRALERALQPNESLTDYFWHKKTLLTYAFGEPFDNEAIIDEIYWGLSEYFKAFVDKPNGGDLMGYLKALQAKEEVIRALAGEPGVHRDPHRSPTLHHSRNRNNGNPRSACRGCGELHWSRVCPRRAPARRQPQYTQQQWQNQSSRNY